VGRASRRLQTRLGFASDFGQRGFERVWRRMETPSDEKWVHDAVHDAALPTRMAWTKKNGATARCPLLLAPCDEFLIDASACTRDRNGRCEHSKKKMDWEQRFPSKTRKTRLS